MSDASTGGAGQTTKCIGDCENRLTSALDDALGLRLENDQLQADLAAANEQLERCRKASIWVTDAWVSKEELDAANERAEKAERALECEKFEHAATRVRKNSAIGYAVMERDHIQAECDQAREQVERMREALQRIIDRDWHVGGEAIDAMNDAQRWAEESLDALAESAPGREQGGQDGG